MTIILNACRQNVTNSKEGADKELSYQLPSVIVPGT
jgi:hypothetical protein